jgi:transcriptional regulator with XRE-family HTH domain
MAASALSMIENGHRNPSMSALSRIAAALDVPVSDLFPKGQSPLPFDEPGRASGIDYSACQRALAGLCARWQPVLQDAVSQDRLDPETFGEFESLVGGLTPFIDAVVQVEMAEMGQQFDEDGDPVFWSERSGLWPALGRFQEIALHLNRLARKHLGEESAVVIELADVRPRWAA